MQPLRMKNDGKVGRVQERVFSVVVHIRKDGELWGVECAVCVERERFRIQDEFQSHLASEKTRPG